ncbi:MAG: ankyrin repeat domain-containing protein [Cocleimonas sp.]|nr:ankyrin repeat domain-containing protein [Cocleimonas sp.]
MKTLQDLLLVVFLLLSLSAVATAADNALNGKLQQAASKGDVKTINALLKQGADINTKSRFGKTPTMQAAEAGKSEAIMLLLSRGADVNARTRSGSSALTYAAENGHEEITAMLVEMGANVHDRTRTGWDAMMIASREGYATIVAQLIEFGADVRASDRRGNSALMYAIEGDHEEVVKTLFHYSDKVSPCVPNDQGITPLMMSIDKRNRTITLLLLPLSKNISHKDRTGTTVLHRAAVLGTAGLITELLELNAMIDSQDEDGNTPLMLAVAVTEMDAIKLLIEKGADLKLKNGLDETVLDLAKKSKNTVIIDLLKKAMDK